MNMFCYQCQETAQNKGCTVKGVCGKTSDVANLQDLLIFLLKGISRYTVEMRKKGIEVSAETNHFVMESLFMTITNANFDKERFVTRIQEAIALRDKLAAEAGNITADCDCMTWRGNSLDEMEAKAATVGVLKTENEDVRSLRELLTYGLKGMAAYAEHAVNLGFDDEEIQAFMQEALVATTQELSADELTALVLKCGEYGVKTMALLDKANTSTYGNPEITKVNLNSATLL